MALACPANREKLFPKCELPHTSRPIPERCCLRMGGSGRLSGECRFKSEYPAGFIGIRRPLPRWRGPGRQALSLLCSLQGASHMKPNAESDGSLDSELDL